jgi:hypothetical protein
VVFKGESTSLIGKRKAQTLPQSKTYGLMLSRNRTIVLHDGLCRDSNPLGHEEGEDQVEEKEEHVEKEKDLSEKKERNVEEDQVEKEGNAEEEEVLSEKD